MAILIFIFRQLIIDIIFQVGNFKEADRALTASVLGIFMFSVMSQSLMHVITRAYYAFQNTKTPFLVAVFSIILNVWLSYVLGLQLKMGVRGIAISTVIAYNIKKIAGCSAPHIFSNLAKSQLPRQAIFDSITQLK